MALPPGARDIRSDRRFVKHGSTLRIWITLPDGICYAKFVDFWWGQGRSGIWKLRWHAGSKWPS